MTLADRPGADQLDAAAEARLGRALVAHLGADALLPRRLAHQPGLEDRVRQRLLAVDVLAHPHRHDRGRGVGVVGRADTTTASIFVPISSSSLRKS